MAGAQRGSRNRAPCAACQTSKRKCDLIRPSCTRCTERKIACVPSRQARWRVAALSRDMTSTFTFDSPPDVVFDVDFEAVNSPPQIVIGDYQHAGFGAEGRPRPAGRNEIQQLQVDGESLVQELDDFNFENLIGDANLSSISNYPATGSTSASQNEESLVNLPSTNVERGSVDGSYDNLLVPENVITACTDQSRTSGDSATCSYSNLLARYDSPSQFEGDIITPHLWNKFISVIVVEITPFGSQEDNPFVRFLATQAMAEPALFAAVIYLSNTVMSKRTFEHLEHASASSEQDFHLGAQRRNFELQSTEILNRSVSVSASDSTCEALLLSQFATMITLSTAYIADGNTEKQQIHLEMALVFVQSLFKKFQTNDTFLFLLKWLGYIHTTAMLSFGTYNVKAPDYISIAQESQVLNSLYNQSGRRRNQIPPCYFRVNGFSPSKEYLFPDIDDLLGISTALTTAMYKLGRLYRLRQAAVDSNQNSQWFWQDFEAEADDLETRIEQQLAMTRRPFDADISSSALDNYNNALLHTVRLIFWCDVKGSPPSQREQEKMVGDLLEFCAAIPVESLAAKLSVLPLFHAGVRSRRHLHREFVKSRLTELNKSVLVVNISQVLEILKFEWEENDSGAPTSNHVNGELCILF